ncbi:MAG: PD-(D/E)XK nuclease family protein [Sedimentisphaerales bacterium]
MAVRFILGKSGTGKTHHCVSAIADSLLQPTKQPLLLLVPEQATYQAQQAILNDPRIAGYNRLLVLSFDRLVGLVSGQKARPAISRLGRTMVIQRVLRDCADRLTVFGDCARLPGLGKRLAETINQLQHNANTPDDVKALVGEMQKKSADKLTTAKFADIAVVFEEYIRHIEGKFIDPDIQLAAACQAVAKADFVKGAKLWVDGFAGFTAAELAILTELLKVVEDAQIALCLDPTTIDLSNPDKSQVDLPDLFGPTVQTYAELIERIKKCKLKLTAPLILNKPQRFSQNAPLDHVERSIFTTRPGKIAVDGKIRIISAPNARAETQFIARQITKLVRQNGYRYRDIAVIASDLDSYENYIKSSFEDYRIPVFIDKRIPLSRHPVIDFLCSAVSAVTNNFANNDIFAYLKTDLLDVERNDVYLLENYCVAFGIVGADWQKTDDWRFAAENAESPQVYPGGYNQQQVNRIRKKAISPLLRLYEKIDACREKLTAEQFTALIFDFLETAGVRKVLTEWVDEAFEKKDFVTADEHRQLYERLVDVFDQLCEVFAGVQMSFSDYFEIAKCAFSQITLAFIPPSLDQVLVGSIERSRHPDLKTVFLLGATERQFPSPVAFDSILSEDDRIAAGDCGLELSTGVRQELAGRAYLAYIAFTRASDSLYITYPAVDQKSNTVVRSPFIDNLCQLFDDLREERISPIEPAADEIFSQYDVEDLLCIYRDARLIELAPRVCGAIIYENKAGLNDALIDKLFLGTVSSSASRLSTFAACPYKHFAKYVLDLKKRDEFKLEPLDMGDLFHRVLDAFTKRVVAEKINFETASADVLIKILDEEIERICRQDAFISRFASHNLHNSFIIESAVDYLHDCVVAVSQMIVAGSFRPVMSEVVFGRSESFGSSIGEFAITLNGGRRLLLNGRIDRIDIAGIDSRKVALVFDYKTSEETFIWAEFFYGLDMQLPIYLNAVLKADGSHKIASEVAGAFYLPIKPKLSEIAISDLADSQSKFAHKARGIFNGRYFQQLDSTTESGWSPFYSFYVGEEKGQYANYDRSSVLKPDDFDAVLKFTEGKIARIAGQIFSGKIDVNPYRLSGKFPCENCDYKPVCRFDWQINDYNLLSAVGKQQVIEKIRNTNEPKES